MVMTIAIPLRKYYGLEDFVTMRHLDYIRVTDLFLEKILLPLIRNTARKTYYLNTRVVHPGDEILHTSSLSEVFPDAATFFAWSTYDKRRFELEFRQSHGILLDVTYWKVDEATTKADKKKNPALLWYKSCTAEDVERDWKNAGIRFNYKTAEDLRNVGS